MLTDLNYWAVLVSAVFFVVFGGLWFGAIFKKQWEKAAGFSKEQEAKAKAMFPQALLAHFVAGLLISFFLSNIAGSMAAFTFTEGMAIGFLAWIGIALPVTLIEKMFEMRHTTLFFLNNLNYLVALAIMGGILAVWP